MKYVVKIVVMMLLVATARSGEVIDRIVAVVNRGVVLQSDVDLALRYEAFLGGSPLERTTEEDYKKAVDRLIDQELLRQEMGDALEITDQEVRKRIEEIRSQMPEARTADGWQACMERYGLSQGDLEERVRVQLELWQFVELRLKPNVRVDESAVESYYRDEFLPKLRQAGGKDIPLSEVSARIRQILVERSIDQLLSAWLHNLRDQSEIHTELDAHTPAIRRDIPLADRAAATKVQ